MKKALSGPDQHTAFLRKCWLLIIAVMAFSSLSAQDDSARFSRINGYGFFYKRMGIDSVLYVPLYESAHTPYRAGAIKYRKSDSSFYKYTGTQWLKVEEGGAATNGIDTVYTINDTVQVIETADETYFTIINSPYTEVLNDSTIIVGNDTLIIAGASGGGIWGEITGTLSDQTDLDAALDAKLEVVTTDATLTGDGTAGDPLKVDTLLTSTRAWRQKGIDSLGVIIATKLSAVNLDTTRDATSATILNDAGDDAVIPLVSIPANKAGLISPAMAAHVDSSMRGLLFDSSEVVNIGDGQNLVYSNETKDTLFVKRLKDSRYITYTTDTDSSIVTTFDTAQLRTDMNIPLEGGGGGGTPGGNDTEVQFNDGGAFGGDTGFTFNKTTNELTVDSLTSYHLYADSMRATLRILAGSAIQPFNNLVTETIEIEAVDDQPIISILDTNTTTGSASFLWFRGLYSNLTNTKKILGYISGESDANGGQLKLFGTAANQTATYNLGLTVRQTGRVVVGSTSGSNARLDVFDASGEHLRLLQATGVYAAFRVFTAASGILRITTTGGQITTDRLHLGGAATPAASSWMLNVDGSVRINKDSVPLVSTISNEHVLIEDTTTGQVKRIAPTFESIIYTNNAVVTATGTTETDLYSVTTRANELDADGESLEFVMHAALGNNTGDATFRVYWAGTEVFEATTTSSDIWPFEIRVTVTRTSSSNARVFVRVIGGGFDLSGTTPNPKVTNVTTTFSNTNIIKATGQGSDAGTSIDMFEGVLKFRPTVSL